MTFVSTRGVNFLSFEYGSLSVKVKIIWWCVYHFESDLFKWYLIERIRVRVLWFRCAHTDFISRQCLRGFFFLHFVNRNTFNFWSNTTLLFKYFINSKINWKVSSLKIYDCFKNTMNRKTALHLKKSNLFIYAFCVQSEWKFNL